MASSMFILHKIPPFLRFVPFLQGQKRKYVLEKKEPPKLKKKKKGRKAGIMSTKVESFETWMKLGTVIFIAGIAAVAIGFAIWLGGTIVVRTGFCKPDPNDTRTEDQREKDYESCVASGDKVIQASRWILIIGGCICGLGLLIALPSLIFYLSAVNRQEEAKKKKKEKRI